VYGFAIYDAMSEPGQSFGKIGPIAARLWVREAP
jgi:hypothetical protein